MGPKIGDLQEWRIDVPKIPDNNNGLDCGPNATRWGWLVTKHGSPKAALDLELAKSAPAPSVAREQLFDIITGKRMTTHPVTSPYPIVGGAAAAGVATRALQHVNLVDVDGEEESRARIRYCRRQGSWARWRRNRRHHLLQCFFWLRLRLRLASAAVVVASVARV